MNSYSGLAAYWDEITGADALEWADYLEKRFEGGVKTVVELACGTGAVAIELAKRGYDVTATDISEEMLAAAASKSADMENRPMLLCQDMRELDLYGTYDAAICCLDSLNYLRDLAELEKTIARVRLFVEPGGLFIFDMNTEEKYLAQDGRAFVNESENAFCVWQAEYARAEKRCDYFIDLFAKRGESWERFSEEHSERLFTPREVLAVLQRNGFEDADIYGAFSDKPPAPGEQRVFVAAKRRSAR